VYLSTFLGVGLTDFPISLAIVTIELTFESLDSISCIFDLAFFLLIVLKLSSSQSSALLVDILMNKNTPKTTEAIAIIKIITIAKIIATFLLSI
jgi:hypothetical protein